MNERGTGVTTGQMLGAPSRALFIWCNEQPSYARELARNVGRADLFILSPNQAFEHNAERLRSRPREDVVVDHALRLTGRQERLLLELMAAAVGTRP